MNLTSTLFDSLTDKNCYIYTRVSSKNQINPDISSLDVQSAECMQYAKEKKMIVKQIVKEVGSAFNTKQPKLEELVEVVPENSIILVHMYDRFSRNLEYALKNLKRLSTKKVYILSVTEKLDYTTPLGRHQLTTHISLAQCQSETLGLKVRRSITYRKQQGMFTGSVVPYGFKLNGKRMLVSCDHEQLIIHLITSLREGTSNVKEVNKILTKIIGKSRNNNPLKFYEQTFDKNTLTETEINTISPNSLTYQEIADILNDYDITKRGCIWTKSNTSDIYQKNKNKKRKMNELSSDSDEDYQINIAIDENNNEQPIKKLKTK